jgi:peptidoglycan/xylan/chitin deacetylase (PgdA/CDA1 family)
MRTSALMYHDVVRADRGPSGFPGAGPARYALGWDEFVAHLDLIHETVGAPPVLVERLPAPDRRSAWVLTFDDGGASATDVGEELARRGWQGYFLVTAGLVGTEGFLEAAAVRELDRLGHVVGSHSVTHPDRMGALAFEEILREWRESCDVLADLVGKPTRAASVPGGYYRRRVAVAAARAGIVTLFNSEPVRTVRSVDGCLVVGRYGVRDATAAREAAAAAAGEPSAWRRQYVGWNLRKPVKVLGGERYERARRALLASRSGRRARS